MGQRLNIQIEIEVPDSNEYKVIDTDKQVLGVIG